MNSTKKGAALHTNAQKKGEVSTVLNASASPIPPVSRSTSAEVGRAQPQKPNGASLDGATPKSNGTPNGTSNGIAGGGQSPGAIAEHVNGYGPILWLCSQPDEARFCQLFANTGNAEAVFKTRLRAGDFNDDVAALIFEAGFAVYASGAPLTPESLAEEARKRADECDRQSETERWENVAQIALLDLTRLPRDLSNRANVNDEAAKLAAKLVAARHKRAHPKEPTADEIKQTAEAVRERGERAHFPELSADAIPSPALLTGDKPEYDPHQLRALLYPQGRTVSLCTEAAHAERAALYIGDSVLFCPQLGFLHFDPRHGLWRADDREGALTAAALAALAPVIRAEAAALLRSAATLAHVGRDTDARAMSRGAGGVLGHAGQIEKRSFLAGAATFLAGLRRAEVERFAPAPWKFAWSNLVFDRGQWRRAQRDDYLLQVSPVALDRKADRGEWNALLDRITGGDGEFARTLQDVCAYALSGASSLRKLPWFYGPPGTAKSTVCDLIQTVLGESASTIDTAMLQDNSSRERLGATLWNRRAAFVAEAGNKRIDAELLKTLSGGDRLSVRFLYREAFTAKPSHVLFLAANDPPRTDAYDPALKERVIALPFVHRLDSGPPLRFTGHTRIESARMDADCALLHGFAAWQAEGLERLFAHQEIYTAPRRASRHAAILGRHRPAHRVLGNR